MPQKQTHQIAIAALRSIAPVIGGLGTADATGAIGFPTGVGPGMPVRDIELVLKKSVYFFAWACMRARLAAI